MKPFVYWFAYTDRHTTTYWNEERTFEQQDSHVLQCVLLADFGEDALSWGNHLSEKFLKTENALSIDASWIEEMVPEVVNEIPSHPTDWMRLLNAIPWHLPAPPYFKASAIDSGQSERQALHALVYANTETDATKTWASFLEQNYPHLEIEYVSLWSIPIALIGEDVEWE